MNFFRRGAPAGLGVAGEDVDMTFTAPSGLLAQRFWCGVCCLLVTVSSFAGEPVRLTQDGSLKRDPRFVDGGHNVVYCYDETPALVRMMKLFADAADKHHYEPAFSPNGKWISFTACTGNLSGKLVIRNLESGEQVDITHKGRGGTRSPTFSPDSERVVYAFAEKGPQQLWSVKTDGTNKQQLTTCSGVSNWPTFTPDGRTIVFSNSREKNYEIYSAAVDGSAEHRLTNNTLMEIRPAVSPNGRKVAFVSTRTGNYDVFVMNIDGSNVQQITTSEERDDYPNWHPNGEQLVIVSERDGAFDLYLFDVSQGRALAGQ